jgi:hypothetical protein
MSTNIDHVEVLKSTLRISEANATKAKALDLPESALFGLKFEPNGYAPLPRFFWYGERSGNAYHDGTLEKFVGLTEGDADVIFVWEGGNGFTGLRIRNGTMKECDVVMTLAPEESI